MYRPLRPVINLEQLQDHFQLTETDTGVTYQSLLNTDLYDLLQPYIETVDYRMYFEYSNRVVIGKYVKQDENNPIIKDSLIKKAVYYALKGEEYNLRTLINSTTIDYDPIENYYLSEQITSTSSIGAFTEYGEQSTTNTTSHSSFVTETVDQIGETKSRKEISKPEYSTLRTVNHGTVEKQFTKDETYNNGSHTDTLQHDVGAQSNTHETISDIGTIVTDNSTTNEIGKRDNSIGVEEKVSAYNTSTYQPNTNTDTSNVTQAATDKTTGKETVNGHTDTTNITDSLGERVDKDTNIYGEQLNKVSAENGEKTIGYVDSETFHQDEITDVDTTTEDPKTNTSTATHNPHSVNSQSVNRAHRDDTSRTEDGTRNRELHGRYGYTTVQDMLRAERELANLNITDKIINIIVHAICEGVLMTW